MYSYPVHSFKSYFYLNHILNPNFRKHSLCASMASLQFSSPFCKMLKKKLFPFSNLNNYIQYKVQADLTSHFYREADADPASWGGGAIPPSGWTLRLDLTLIKMQIWLFHTFLYNMLTYLVQANIYFRLKCHNNKLGLTSKSFSGG